MRPTEVECSCVVADPEREMATEHFHLMHVLQYAVVFNSLALMVATSLAMHRQRCRAIYGEKLAA